MVSIRVYIATRMLIVLTKEVYNHIFTPRAHRISTDFRLDSKHACTIAYTEVYTSDVCISCSIGTVSTFDCRDNILNG